MIEKQIRDAISKVYALNDEFGDKADIYAFPFEEEFIKGIMIQYKEYSSSAFVPKTESEEDICPYVLFSFPYDNGGYRVFAFTTGIEVDRLLAAIRKVAIGEEPE